MMANPYADLYMLKSTMWSHFMREMRSWRHRIIQDKFSRSNTFALFKTSRINRDFINIFYIAMFEIRTKCDRIILAPCVRQACCRIFTVSRRGNSPLRLYLPCCCYCQYSARIIFVFKCNCRRTVPNLSLFKRKNNGPRCYRNTFLPFRVTF
jgi:hypothetical protein